MGQTDHKLDFVLASHNPKKLKEMREILKFLQISVSALPENAPIPEENGDSFEANALIKARAACFWTGYPAIADDSGLCVDALGGAPGIYSARYGSLPGTTGLKLLPIDAPDSARTQRLLLHLKDVPDGKRQAHFVSAIACVFPDGKEFTVRGECTGEIASQIYGNGGFGYDPVFYLPEYHCTFGELDPSVKNQISHRALALEKLREKLASIL